MLLRRITRHVTEQNWFAVFIDFIIVVVGVFIGIQVANWNETQNNKKGMVAALERLNREVSQNISSIDKILDHYQANNSDMSAGRESLDTCTYSAEGQAALERLLFDFVEDVQPNFVTVVADQLAAQNSYQVLLSVELREGFGDYIADIQEEEEQLTSHYNNMWAHHINRHPFVDAYFSNDVSSIQDYSGWGFRLDKPFEEVCKDASFRNRFINTMGFYTSINHRLIDFKVKVEAFQQLLKVALESQ
ncbi:DUF6090 family protein [Marinicella sp. S1101]|uniref:DUF6090 family protein n=1 Tax=Marinicella marina TaxID=2996016 RepID=UPI002260C130|nr:DUF6090 family protein [Marinicella marina]MCX7554746.1 DUF6090 family protein [Marinicella marina]MDJ1141438.1 DUF6090 family protein [Marinicella marina]